MIQGKLVRAIHLVKGSLGLNYQATLVTRRSVMRVRSRAMSKNIITRKTDLANKEADHANESR